MINAQYAMIIVQFSSDAADGKFKNPQSAIPNPQFFQLCTLNSPLPHVP
jgi:hypothetical protein